MEEAAPIIFFTSLPGVLKVRLCEVVGFGYFFFQVDCPVSCYQVLKNLAGPPMNLLFLLQDSILC